MTDDQIHKYIKIKQEVLRSYTHTTDDDLVAMYDLPQQKVSQYYVQRRLFNIPTIIENPSEVWDLIETSGKEYSEEFLSQLPNPKWTFAFSLQRNEMVIIGLTKNDFEYALQNGDKKTLAQHLYKVQSISHNDYCFTRHTETKYDKNHANSPSR